MYVACSEHQEQSSEMHVAFVAKKKPGGFTYEYCRRPSPTYTYKLVSNNNDDEITS